jgi:hypothetical protein
MRAPVGLIALVGLVGLTRPAMAQASPSTFLGGVSPSSLISKPIDTSHAIAPNPGLSAQQSRFSFATLFRKMSPGFPSQRGMSAMPIPSSFPSSSYNPFKMVGSPPTLIGDPKRTAMPVNVPTPFIPTVNSPVGPGSGG